MAKRPIIDDDAARLFIAAALGEPHLAAPSPRQRSVFDRFRRWVRPDTAVQRDLVERHTYLSEVKEAALNLLKYERDSERMTPDPGRSVAATFARRTNAVIGYERELRQAATLYRNYRLPAARREMERNLPRAIFGAAALAISVSGIVGRPFGSVLSGPADTTNDKGTNTNRTIDEPAAPSSPSTTVPVPTVDTPTTPSPIPTPSPADVSSIAVSNDKTHVTLKVEDRHGNTPRLSTGVFYPGCAGQMVMIEKMTKDKAGKSVAVTFSALILPDEDYKIEKTTGDLTFNIAVYKKGSIDTIPGELVVRAIGLPKEAKPADSGILSAGVEGDISPDEAGDRGRVVFVMTMNGKDLEPVTATTAMTWERNGDELTLGVEANDRGRRDAASERTFPVGKALCP